MDESFWHQRWSNNNIGFHEGAPNALLVEHFDALAIPDGGRVFVPLCGKTVDMAWLRSKGLRVVGVELSEQAVEQFFAEQDVTPTRSDEGALPRYSADGVDIFVGDVFRLSGDLLGPVDAVYDRAALVALPEAMRSRYTAHVMEITAAAPQLLICFEYDQRKLDGPPFSMAPAEVSAHYGATYDVTRVAQKPVPGGLKGVCAATEDVWLLQSA